MSKFFMICCSLFFALFSPAMAAETFKASGAIASFYSVTESGCLAKHRFLFAASEGYRAGGSGDLIETFYITEFDYDKCVEVAVSSASGRKQLTKHELDIRSGYARIMTTVELFDQNGISTFVPVDLTWYGTGNQQTIKLNTVFEGPDKFRVVVRYNGSSETATVTGYFGSESVLTAGNIDFVRSGTVTIER